MTREEAIMELNRFSGTTRLRLSANFWEALDMAIKVLKQEPCEDAVSRKAVLDTLDNMDSVLDEDRTVESYKKLLMACYNDLPPVTPTRKKGKWIPCRAKLEGDYELICKAESTIPLDRIKKAREQIIDEKDFAYADFERYKEEVLHVESDELPDDDFRFGMERCLEILDNLDKLMESEEE